MSKKRTDLVSDLTVEGYWWLPEKQHDKVVGTLRFNPSDGITLSLLGVLHTGEHHFQLLGTTFSPPVIFGLTADGKAITLAQSFQSSFKVNMPGIATQSLRSQFVFIGDHITDPMEKLFSGCRFRQMHLESWLQTKHFKWSSSAAKTGLEVEAKASEKKMISSINSNLIYKTYVNTTSGDISARIDASIFFELQPTSPEAFKALHRHAIKISNLAALCFGEPVHLTEFSLLDGETEIAPGKKIPKKIDLLYQPFPSIPVENNKYAPPILSYAEVTKEEATLSLWFTESHKLKSVFDLFFSVFLNGQTYLDVRFLLTIQAIEVFHRLNNPMMSVSTEEIFENVKEVITQAIPENTPTPLKEKLISSLQFLNEPSLRQRLKQCVKLLEQDFGILPLGFDKDMIGRIVDTRNYLTHYTNDLKSKALENEGMHYATRRMQVLLLSLLLNRIGISFADIRAILEKHLEFKTYLQTAEAIK
jgi:hypothetical protein